MIGVFASCVASSVVSWDILLHQRFPALSLCIYWIGAVVATVNGASNGPRAYVSAAVAIIMALAVSVGQAAVHKSVQALIVFVHACCTLEHMSYDSRYNTFTAVLAIDTCAALIVLYGKWRAAKKDP